MYTFMVCLVVAAGGLGFIGGVLLAGSSAYEAGWAAHARQEASREAERRRAGFRVVS